MKIIKAKPIDNELLTDITKKAKAFWGYSDEQINDWNELLTITKTYIENIEVYKLIFEDKIIGYYSFYIESRNTIKLDNLFILPEFIGQGFGKLLLNDFLLRIKNTAIKNVILESDPNASGFYEKFGFLQIGKLETSIKDRFLPIMELNI